MVAFGGQMFLLMKQIFILQVHSDPNPDTMIRQPRSLACRYENPMPELTLSPCQRSMNSATDLQNTKLPITYQKIKLILKFLPL
jgi:hypothetical protein